MPNLHKSLNVLITEIKPLNKNLTEAKITEVLNSFLQQNSYGVPILEAFENSIYNPSTKKNLKKEREILKGKRKIKSKKFALLLRHQFTIVTLIKAGNGSRKIAKYLNSHKLVNQKVSHVLVNNFINDEKLK